MKFLRMIVAVLFISVPISVTAEQAKTIDEIVKKYDSSSCKECHEEIYEQWEKSHHARSLMGLNDNIIMAPVLKSGHLSVKAPKDATQINFPCFKCHLPQAVNADNSLYAEIAGAVLSDNKDIIRKLNIGCLVCHNEKAIIHKLQDGKPEEGVIYGNKDVEDHLGKDYKTVVKKSPIMKRAVVCGQCHGLGPNFEFDDPVQCASLYGSYLNAYIPDGGTKTCQECHMKENAHTFLPDYSNKEETSKFLAESISLDVETLGYYFLSPEKKHIPTVVVSTKITNMAGHRFPDG